MPAETSGFSLYMKAIESEGLNVKIQTNQRRRIMGESINVTPHIAFKKRQSNVYK